MVGPLGTFVGSGGIAVIAEVDEAALRKRHSQGWVQEVVITTSEAIERVQRARTEAKPVSIAFLGESS